MMRRLTLLLLLCFSISVPASAYTVRDAAKRTLTFDYPPTRIVSQLPSATEVLFAIGAGGRVVGVTQFCTFPAEAQKKISVGGYTDANLELVLSLQPDLVIIGNNSHTARLIRLYSQFGFNVLVVDPSNYQGTLATIRLIGEACDLKERAMYEAQKLSQACLAITQAVRDQEHPRVLFCVMLKPLVVARPQTLLDDLIRMAGARNAMGYGPNDYPTLNAEALLACNPDVIIASPHEGSGDVLSFFSQWPDLKAVQNGAVYSVNRDHVHRPGPRLSLGIREMAEKIHRISIPFEKN
jgi:iron complex transport system substrate-binding protein